MTIAGRSSAGSSINPVAGEARRRHSPVRVRLENYGMTKSSTNDRGFRIACHSSVGVAWKQLPWVLKLVRWNTNPSLPTKSSVVHPFHDCENSPLVMSRLLNSCLLPSFANGCFQEQTYCRSAREGDGEDVDSSWTPLRRLETSITTQPQ
jgi:hypothetical protein